MRNFPIPNAEITISEPETLKVIADSLRLQILKQLKQPATVKQVGEALDLAPSNLYYHFSQLEKHKFIQVVDTRLVSGIVEKHYQVAARRFKVDDTLLATPVDAAQHIDGLLAAIFDNAKLEIKKSVEAGIMPLGKETPCREGVLIQTTILPSQSQLDEFCSRLQPIIDDCDTLSDVEDGGSGQPYGFFLAFYPLTQSERATE
jgi:DNA-binding transcriptional ArsR family regulator